MPQPRLLVLDGTNLLYRSYHALAASKLSHAGRPVWAVHGLLLQIVKLLEHARPSHLVIAFDTPEGCPTRRALDPGYKTTRTAPVQDLAVQLSWAPSILRQLGFCVLDDQQWEADDIVASAVAAGRRAGLPSTVVTSDRDAYQLLADDVEIRTPENRTVTVETLLRDHGVSPSGYALLAALRGEPSDNLPGVGGVGPKTAAKLVTTFGSFDAIEQATDVELRRVAGPKTIEALRRDLHLARRSFEVGRLRSDLVVELSPARLDALDPQLVRRVLETCGLTSAGSRLAGTLQTLRTLPPGRE
jgi:DNA polymerase-1